MSRANKAGNSTNSDPKTIGQTNTKYNDSALVKHKHNFKKYANLRKVHKTNVT